MDAAETCRRARSGAGLTLRELAERAGTSHSTLSAYEQGRVVPRVDTLVRVCAAAGFDVVVELDARTDEERRGQQLLDLLELADAYPVSRTCPLDAPVFPPRRFAP